VTFIYFKKRCLYQESWWNWNGRSVAKLGSERPFIGPEPACGIAMEVAKKAVGDWTIRGHRKHWGSLRGLIQGPSAKKTREILNLYRDQLRWVVGLLTGHCHLKGHLFKLGPVNSTRCERRISTHILCDCEAVAYLRFRRMGHYFMEPGDYHVAPWRKSYDSLGVQDWQRYNQKGKHSRSCRSQCRGRINPGPPFKYNAILTLNKTFCFATID
jgi:hypothetical protein